MSTPESAVRLVATDELFISTTVVSAAPDRVSTTPFNVPSDESNRSSVRSCVISVSCRPGPASESLIVAASDLPADAARASATSVAHPRSFVCVMSKPQKKRAPKRGSSHRQEE
jgi:hypothetical protein